VHNTDKCNYFDPDTQRNPRLRSLPCRMLLEWCATHRELLHQQLPPQHPCFFIAVVPVLTPFANGYLPYHIDQIHLASNYLLASFTLSIAGKARLT